MPAPYNNPYYIMFYGIITRLLNYLKSIGHIQPVDIIFYTQLDQMDKVLSGWVGFIRDAPEEIKNLIGDPPSFKNNKVVLPLQAADFHAGWMRMMGDSLMRGKPLERPRWLIGGDNIRREIAYMEWEHAQELYQRVFGHPPWTYSLSWGKLPTRYPILPLPWV